VDNLKAIEGATFDSQTEEHETGCYPGTRVNILHQIDEWASSTEGKCIFWLQGRAGTGKSTISRTVASQLDQSSHLGASFFFKRGNDKKGEKRNNATRLFTTIAAQLVQHLPSMSDHVRNAIDADPKITEKTKKEQFEKLILEPLRKLDDSSETSPRIMIIVIDALDECDQEQDVANIIGLLPEAKQLPSIRLKFFLTSRPEVLIRNKFDAISSLHDNVALHDVPAPEIEHDISLFLSFRLETFRESQKLPVDWPSQEKVEKLMKMAIPLFIFATTACRFIEDFRQSGNPNDRLEKILEYQTMDHESNLDATYLPALDQMIHGLKPSARSNAIEEFKQVVGSIVILESPLSAVSLAALLGIESRHIDKRLYLLHSVLNVPPNQNDPVTLFHLSFRDFLVDSDKLANEFWVDEKHRHNELASRCIHRMDTLTENIFGPRKPGTLRENIDEEEINRCLPPELQYACLYWVDHLQSSESQLVDNDEVHQFLKKHLLHWFEVLGWMGKVSDGIHAILSLESITAVSKP
jgi:hypothetical protein